MLRTLVLPTVVATPLWLATFPVLNRGWSALGDLDWGVADWLFGFFFTLPGLLLVGLPAAAFAGRRSWRATPKALFLIGAGAVGGGLIAIVTLLGISLLGFMPSVDSGILLVAPLGFLPGLIVTSVWLSFNVEAIRATAENV